MLSEILNWISTNYSLTALILLSTFTLGIIVFFVVIIRLNKLAKQYKALMKGVDGRNLEQLLLSNAKTLDQALLKLEILDDRIKDVEYAAARSIQNVGIVRFNAFKEMGGDLSYAIALLDQKGNGIVISSIYGRDDARTYAKPIKGGKSTYQLSEEEELAIQKTQKEERS
ncbi:MAG: hypothetical protein FD167_3987 [bacterium]|nr:MAG: hypothetical protein FD167_3987 [bacterium]